MSKISDEGTMAIDQLHDEIIDLFDLINDRMVPQSDEGSDASPRDLSIVIGQWVVEPDPRFKDLNSNHVLNNGSRVRKFAHLFKGEMNEYIRQSGGSGNNVAAAFEKFNAFFKQGKIEIKRSEMGNSRNSLSSINSSSSASRRRSSLTPVIPVMRERSASVRGINQATILELQGMEGEAGDSPYEIHYYPNRGRNGSGNQNLRKVIPFEFQTIISTEEIDEAHEGDRNILLAFINIVRKYYVDRLIQIITQLIFYHCDKKTGIDTKCSVVAVGSISLTSNYDVTVSGVIYPNRIVRMFNQEFAKFWGDFSSNVFDTNLYGSTFFVTLGAEAKVSPDHMKLYQELGVGSQKILYLPPLQILDAPTPLGEIRKSQLEWLVVKIFLHQLVYLTPDGTGASPLFSLFTNRILPEIWQLVGGNRQNRNVGSMVDRVFKAKFGEKTTREMILNTYEDKALTLKSYEQSLVQIESSQLRYEAVYLGYLQSQATPLLLPPPPQGHANSSGLTPEQKEVYDILFELIDNISKSNFYGSETYFCMATIYHVLGYVQGLGKFPLSAEDRIISALENYIDIFRYYSKLTATDPQYAIIKMSKYVYRIYNALNGISPGSGIYAEKMGLWQSILKELKGQHSFDSVKGSPLLAELGRIYGGTDIGNLMTKMVDDVIRAAEGIQF